MLFEFFRGTRMRARAAAPMVLPFFMFLSRAIEKWSASLAFTYARKFSRVCKAKSVTRDIIILLAGAVAV